MCQLIRQHSGLRQDDIAAIVGLTQPFLSMLESGARKLTNIDKIVQLLDGLQAPPELTGPMLRARVERMDRSLGALSAQRPEVSGRVRS
ncbi:helix-turn-helix domain-containing protein [Streptomyces sp. NPDC002851]